MFYLEILLKTKIIDDSSFFLELNNLVNTFKKNPKSVVCLTGKSFKFILKNYKEEIKTENSMSKLNKTLRLINKKKDPNDTSTVFRDLAELIREKGRIYSRMKPKQKVELIKFLKENKSNIVSMCGDAANDTAAIMHSDVGISISNSHSEKLDSHFFSSNDSILCLLHIIKNGKACLENTVFVHKFILMYSIIQNCSRLVLIFYNFDDFTINQYLYIDFYICFLGVIISSRYNMNKTVLQIKLN